MDLHLNLRTFAEVVRSKSFSEAARTLHVVPSVVAKRIAQLEKTAGARLFDRNSRAFHITEAGEALHARALPLLHEFEEVLQATRRSEGALEGHIRLMAPTTLTMLHLGKVLDAFLAQHPGITMEIALIDKSVNPTDEGYDLAISGRIASYDGVVDIPLCPIDVVVCVAPHYLQMAGSPAHPRDLTDHACLVFKPYGKAWTFQGQHSVVSVDVQARLTADDHTTLLNAAISGRGLAKLPRYVCGPALSEGLLVEALPGWKIPTTTFRAYVPHRRLPIARVKSLIEWLTRHLPDLMPPKQAPSTSTGG